MEIGIIGLGKMGYNLALNMIDNEFKVFGFDTYFDKTNKELDKNFIVAETMEEMLRKLSSPRAIWVMVPSGDITDQVMGDLKRLLKKGDIVIDGGNSRYSDSQRRYTEFRELGISFMDVGTSGGTTGARNGASLMIGGDKESFDYLEPLFKALAVENGYGYMGVSGAGHFVKMIHNGIEYGMMQAIGEGFDVLEASQFDLDYKEVSKVWANGSIIKGLLIDMVVNAFSKDPKLNDIDGRVDDSGEGQWTIEEALKLKVSVPVMSQALFSRYKSKDDNRFAEKIVAAMRNEFGGHKVYKK